MRIVLIGFRGTGKSSVGKRLAKLTGMKYLSTDDVIKGIYMMSISEIVANFGWRDFRKKESETIQSLQAMDNIIIDSGGGSILTKKNRDNLKKGSFVVLLSANRNDIMKRIMQGVDRPNLTSLGSMRKEIAQLMKERKGFYDSIADLRINTSKKGINETAEIIFKKVKGKL